MNDALAEAAASAPASPGVYYFLGASDDLRYVGTATNLRRRLADHAREAARADGVRRVRWEVHADADAALLREADLIVLLRPALNRSHTTQASDVFVSLRDAGDVVGFSLGGTPVDRAYGSFPHVAKGTASKPSKRMRAGYTALLRLLWAAQPGAVAARIPGRIAGGSPPLEHECPVSDLHARPLHEYLSGRGARLVDTLSSTIASSDVPDFMHPSLLRDAAMARDFFVLGPRRLRELRLRYGLPVGPVTAETLTAIYRSEVSRVAQTL